jgi:hypothetical protein
VKQSLYLSERIHDTWLFRPAMYTALELVYKAYKEGKIAGAFVFSNNGSADLVQFIADYCNYWMWRKHRDYSNPRIFQLAVSRGSPLRSPGSLEKSYAEIQRSLGGADLPLPTGPQDLLFFDDMSHQLQWEIPHYVQVRAYMNACPLERVMGALKTCADFVTPDIWAHAVESAHAEDLANRRESAVSMPPTVKDTRMDTLLFETAFQHFLNPGVGGTRRRRRCRRSTRRMDRHK